MAAQHRLVFLAKGPDYCDERACVSVGLSARDHMLNVKKRCPDFTKLSVHVTLGQPPLAALQIVM